MGDPAENRDGRFTLRQYKSWPPDERWELIDGAAWSMFDAPSTRHQMLVGRLFARLSVFLEGKPCMAFVAPYIVLLPRGDEADDEDIDSVVQPDISVFCDRAKILSGGARGAPDFVIEVLSPSTSKKDQGEKFAAYENRGVREYWIVDPGSRWLCVYRQKARERSEGSVAGKFGKGELHIAGEEPG